MVVSLKFQNINKHNVYRVILWENLKFCLNRASHYDFILSQRHTQLSQTDLGNLITRFALGSLNILFFFHFMYVALAPGKHRNILIQSKCSEKSISSCIDLESVTCSLFVRLLQIFHLKTDKTDSSLIPPPPPPSI